MEMADTIIAKSDQLNADDLIGRSLTITVSKVVIPGGEQPVTIHYEGDGGKPYKPGKSMRRVLVHVWGPDANAYVGRSMTLYRDDEVVFGGLKVGGIRISHMSHTDKALTMALTATRGNKKAFTVKPLRQEAVQAQQEQTQQPAPRRTLGEYLDECLAGCRTVDDVAALADEDQIIKGAMSRQQVRARLDARARELAPAELPVDDLADIDAAPMAAE